jgi:hypothetical protein
MCIFCMMEASVWGVMYVATLLPYLAELAQCRHTTTEHAASADLLGGTR